MLGTMKTEGENFQAVVSAVQSLCQVQRIQIQEAEEYLQQYGYVSYTCKKQHKGKTQPRKGMSLASYFVMLCVRGSQQVTHGPNPARQQSTILVWHFLNFKLPGIKIRGSTHQEQT